MERWPALTPGAAQAKAQAALQTAYRPLYHDAAGAASPTLGASHFSMVITCHSPSSGHLHLTSP
eukprot:CAMPEP_0168386698 /NCGR_PEP_ID=MMETSP0228-20121227/15562_1 /TAXON_ID=133427 /ORGANISM="Protoceratium reticulatum, Strain CCCM 535 (=CCMP 1889)" /LENGTH=63 /DNA_ID=CAMNT_0008399907 /DNA_START=71 /DNA_END=259 /DNA_ORIENTATION=-